MSEKDIQYIRDIALKVGAITGNQFSVEDEVLVYSRIYKRFKVCGVDDVEAYYKYILQNSRELEFTINAMMNNHTFFFREYIHLSLIHI